MFGTVVSHKEMPYVARAERRESDGQIRITLSTGGEVAYIATKFVDLDQPHMEGFDVKLARGHLLAFVKDYSENEGLLSTLLEHDIVRHAGHNGQPVTIPAGYAQLYVVWVNPMLLP